jgi:hypothetical protein
MVRTELKIKEVAALVHANCFQTVDEIAAAGISHGTCHKILSDDLNMSRVTQQCSTRPDAKPTNDRMSICGDLMDGAIPMLADLHSGQRRLF